MNEIHPIAAHLPKKDAEIVSSWIEPAGEYSSRANRRVVKTLSQYRRANPRRMLLGWAVRNVLHGYSVEDMVAGGGHSGSYFIAIGVGRNGLLDGESQARKIKPNEVGIYIRGRGVHVEKLTDLWREADRVIAARRSRQVGLPI